jgi:cytochrome bd-type quinol oxidase subunit 2
MQAQKETVSREASALSRLTPGRLLLAGLVVFVAGRLVDAAWHATHDEFETAADQLQAHAVVWLGTLLLMAAAAIAISRRTTNRGYAVVLAGTLGYAVVAAWHFWEHSQHRDPDLPHVLLLVTNLIIFLGIGWVWIAPRLGQRAEAARR